MAGVAAPLGRSPGLTVRLAAPRRTCPQRPLPGRRSAAVRIGRRVAQWLQVRRMVSIGVVILIAVWAGASLAVASAGGLFRPRRLPPTRHERRSARRSELLS